MEKVNEIQIMVGSIMEFQTIQIWNVLLTPKLEILYHKA